ncbi:hypothetical protein CU098_013590 [Rhizopus stolonifer]|uniref:Uncharacterized protein n=1 Tax=Rhizopus stolonifer TaxID=4846 RepID=A0A367KV45_RHIST|nr:hypothetical protein CU098_013590 [Rhizopus stolonifer]
MCDVPILIIFWSIEAEVGYRKIAAFQIWELVNNILECVCVEKNRERQIGYVAANHRVGSIRRKGKGYYLRAGVDHLIEVKQSCFSHICVYSQRLDVGKILQLKYFESCLQAQRMVSNNIMFLDLVSVHYGAGVVGFNLVFVNRSCPDEHSIAVTLGQ